MTTVFVPVSAEHIRPAGPSCDSYNPDALTTEVIVLEVFLTGVCASLVWLLLLVVPAIGVVLIAMCLFILGAIYTVVEQTDWWQDEQDAEQHVASLQASA